MSKKEQFKKWINVNWRKVISWKINPKLKDQKEKNLQTRRAIIIRIIKWKKSIHLKTNSKMKNWNIKERGKLQESLASYQFNNAPWKTWRIWEKMLIKQINWEEKNKIGAASQINLI